MVTLEVCCGNLESVHAAVKGGAPRIELCQDLELDGLTPAWEDLKTARALYPLLVIHVLIRPRAGDFCYSPAEVAQMEEEIVTALDLGADGIVTGALNPEGMIDLPVMERLVQTVEDWSLNRQLLSDACHASNDDHFFPSPFRRPSITFHRAFDRCRWPFEALEEIIGLGCDRILTSGCAPSAAEGTDLIRELQKRAGDRLILLPGGGISPQNARRILSLTGCTELHASASQVIDGQKRTSATLVAEVLTSCSGSGAGV